MADGSFWTQDLKLYCVLWLILLCLIRSSVKSGPKPRGQTTCYDLTPCHTIIQMFSSDFHDAAYCKDWYLFMVRHVHIFLCTFL
jgi:hypothetical protein